MSNALTIVKSLRDGILSVNLVGHIDAGADYSAIPFQDVREFHINFRGITLINSAGIQKWVKFMQTVPAHISIFFEECPSNVINQCNLFANFTGGKKVQYVTFMAPYYCESCDEPVEVMLKTSEILSGKTVNVPTPKCPKCGQDADFDGIEDKYFLFLTR